MYTCKLCGRVSNQSFYGKCQSCYKYFHDGGKVHPLPEPGRIVHDERGYMICHICGRAYRRIGTHAREWHGMTIKEYKEQFGLCENARTTESGYSDHMRGLALKYHMDDQLREAGKATRIKKGDTHYRKGKPIRLQEQLEKLDRNKAK